MTDPVERVASCWCGALGATLRGEPALVSACCCTRCQRRTGSFYGVTVYYRPEQLVAWTGAVTAFQPPYGSTTFHLCPTCGSKIWWVPNDEDDWIGVAGGAFADPALRSPDRMTHMSTRHPFVCAPPGLPQFEDGPE